LLHMAAAVETVCADTTLPGEVAEELMGYFVPTAEHLRNDTGLPITSASYPRT
jgi:hemoglobin